MNVQELANLITAAQAPEVRQEPYNYRTASCVDIFSSAGHNLHAYLARQEFEFAHDALFTVGASMTLVEPNMLVNWLMLRADQVGANRASQELSDYLESDCNPGWEILAIKGISLSDRLELEDGLHLVPFNEIPDCPEKHALAPDGYQLAQLDQIGLRPHPALSGFALANPPRAALIREREFTPKYSPRDTSASSRTEPELPDDKLHHLCALLTLTGNGSATPFAGWTILKSATPLSGLLASSLSYPTDIREPFGSSHWSHDQLKEFKELAHLYSYLPMQHQRKVILSSFRLSQSYNAHDTVGTAIDLGIALESLLLPASEHQLALQFALIGAWLTEPDNSAARRTNYKILKYVYTLRSKAVHNGEIPTKTFIANDGNPLSAQEVLNEGIRLAKQCIKAYLRRGGLSDGDREALLVRDFSDG